MEAFIGNVSLNCAFSFFIALQPQQLGDEHMISSHKANGLSDDQKMLFRYYNSLLDIKLAMLVYSTFQENDVTNLDFFHELLKNKLLEFEDKKDSTVSKFSLLSQTSSDKLRLELFMFLLSKNEISFDELADKDAQCQFFKLTSLLSK